MFPIPFNFPFIKKNGERTTIGDAINAGGGGSQYTLPTASAEVKGGVKIGSGLKMTGEVISLNMPTASDETLGGVKVGSGLSITDGVLSAAGGGGGGTQLYYKDFENVDFSNVSQLGETGVYYGRSNYAMGVTDYVPVSVVVTDKNTGYKPLANIFKNGTTNENYGVSILTSTSNVTNAFNVRVYYIKSTDLTPIPS